MVFPVSDINNSTCLINSESKLSNSVIPQKWMPTLMYLNRGSIAQFSDIQSPAYTTFILGANNSLIAPYSEINLEEDFDIFVPLIKRKSFSMKMRIKSINKFKPNISLE